VWLEFYPPGTQQIVEIERKSGPDGVANFHITVPMPEMVHVSLPWDYSPASGAGDVKTQELLNSGAVARFGPEPNDVSTRVSKKPGEIILFAHVLPWWARLIAPLERE